MISRPYKAYQTAAIVRPSVGQFVKEGFRYGYGPEQIALPKGNWLDTAAYAVGQYAKDVFNRFVGQSLNEAQKRQVEAFTDKLFGDAPEPGKVYYEDGIRKTEYTVSQLQDRCNGICKSRYPGTNPVLGASNNCYCKKTPVTSSQRGQLETRCVGICKSQYPGTAPYVNSEGSCFCRKTGTGTGGTYTRSQLESRCRNICVKYPGTAAYVDSKGSCFCRKKGTTGCPYSGCTNQTNASGCYMCRCTGICKRYANTHPQVKGDGSCSCIKNLVTSTKCPYSGCTGLSKGSSCFYCRCSKLCSGKGGVKTVRSDGSCYCKGTTTTTARCPYSGCTGLNAGSSCFYCRCKRLCGSRGVKTVSSNGSCYCKSVTTTTTGCSTYLKQRCGNICVQKGGRPYLDSRCSCFCR